MHLLSELAAKILGLRRLKIMKIPLKDGRTRQKTRPQLDFFVAHRNRENTFGECLEPVSNLVTQWKKISLNVDTCNFKQSWPITPTMPGNTFRAMKGYLKKKGFCGLTTENAERRYVVMLTPTTGGLVLAELDEPTAPLIGKGLVLGEKHFYSSVPKEITKDLGAIRGNHNLVTMEYQGLRYVTTTEMLRVSRTFPNTNQSGARVNGDLHLLNGNLSEGLDRLYAKWEHRRAQRPPSAQVTSPLATPV